MSPKVQRPHMRRVVVMRGDLGGILVQLAVTWRRPKIRFEPAVDQINMAVGRSKEHVHDVLRLPASLVNPPQLDVLQQPEAALPPQLRDDARPDRCRLLQHQPPQRVEPPARRRQCRRVLTSCRAGGARGSCRRASGGRSRARRAPRRSSTARSRSWAFPTS